METGRVPTQSGRSVHRLPVVLLGLVLAVGAMCIAPSRTHAAVTVADSAPDAREQPAPTAEPRRHPRGTRGPRQPRRVIVSLAPGGDRSAFESAATTRRLGTHVKHSRRLGGRDSSYVVSLPDELDDAAFAAAVSALGTLPGVTAVEPVRRVYPSVTPNDPLFPDQWNLRAVAPGYFGSNATAAWDITTGTTGVVIAVIDTGYTDHPDLAGRFLPGYDFVSDVASANDGNGRDPDAHDPGDWVSPSDAASGPLAGCRRSSSSWHGTHVSGIAAATGNNSLGIAGMSWGAKILPVRILGKCGGSTDDLIDAIRWSAGLHVDGVPDNAYPADVVNLSLGESTGSCGGAVQSAITDAITAGSVVVTAAGNDSESAGRNEPGNCSGVINVAATGRFGELADYSNYGAAVTLTAPGGGEYDWGIRSTANGGDTSPSYDTYLSYQGTSMAAPHVAGAAALIISLVPSLTVAQVRSLLTSTARALPASGPYATCVGRCGAGLLDVRAALISAAGLRPPGSPTNLVAEDASTSTTLTWEAPTDTGGTDIVDYLVERSTDSGVTWVPVRDSVSTATSTTVTGLTNGRTYRFRVRAENLVTRGEPSDPVVAAPAAAPGAPRLLRTYRGDHRARLVWRAPLSNGGASITGYVIEESLDGVQWNDVTGTATTATSRTVEGLDNGVRYRFRVAAVNRAGRGAWSTVSGVTPLGRPGAPVALDGTARNRGVSLTWLQPIDNGGSMITRYVLQRSRDGGSSWRTVATLRYPAVTRSFSALRNGAQYVYRIAARNVVGQGPWSATFSVVPRTLPTAPRSLVVTPGDGTLAATWSAPASNGGSPVTAYRIETSTDGVTWTAAATDINPLLPTYMVTGLTNDQTYRVRVGAVNEAGTSPFSNVVLATPAAPAP